MTKYRIRTLVAILGIVWIIGQVAFQIGVAYLFPTTAFYALVAANAAMMVVCLVVIMVLLSYNSEVMTRESMIPPPPPVDHIVNSKGVPHGRRKGDVPPDVVLRVMSKIESLDVMPREHKNVLQEAGTSWHEEMLAQAPAGYDEAPVPPRLPIDPNNAPDNLDLKPFSLDDIGRKD